MSSQCLNEGKINGCPMENQVTISGCLSAISDCPSKLLLVHTWNVQNIHIELSFLLQVWLSVGQLHQYFWLSGDLFVGCLNPTDNQNLNTDQEAHVPKHTFFLYIH